MKTDSGEQNKPEIITGKQFWKNEKFAQVFTGLKKNIFNKSKKYLNFSPQNPSQTLKLTTYPAAIDSGTDSIKFIQLDRAAAGAAIKKIGFSKDSLSALIKENQIQGKVSISLPLSKLQVFSFLLPNIPEKEIAQAIIWKLKQNLPAGIDIASISFDYNWRIYSRDNLNKEILTLVFAASKETVMEKIRFFREFSLEVVAVEPEPYSVFCALHFFKKIMPEETILVLTLGASGSSITIVHAGFACLIRPLAISGNSLTKAIADYHKFDLQKAESVKKSEGLKIQSPAAAVTDSLCMPAVSSQLESLVVDVEHTFKFFSHQLIKLQVTSFDRVILCGGTAALKNLDRFLAEKLGVPVEVFNPLDSSGLVSKEGLSAEIKENGHSFAAAVGMAARYIE